MRRRPRYQVFVSSTFGDLREERERVAWKLLKNHHIPAGMETFPAADDRGWETIRRAIDDSDYYVLIIGWRYGSVDPETGLSWTHREYRYAKERRIPVLAFLRDADATPHSKADQDASAGIRAFRDEIQSEKLYKSWKRAEDLCNAVGEALLHRIRVDEDEETERPGWFRGDAGLVSIETIEELARLSSENHALKMKLDAIGRNEPAELSLSMPSSGQVLTLHPWSSWPETIPFRYSNGATGPLKADDFKRWLDALAFTVWFSLTLLNTGRSLATDVLIELTIPGCKRILLERPDIGSITDSPHPWLLEKAYDNKREGYIQHIEIFGDACRVRQRLNRVLGKSNERLVFFGAVLDDGLEWPEDSGFEAAYSLRDATGVAHDGTLQIPLTVRQGPPLNAGTVQAFYKNLNA